MAAQFEDVPLKTESENPPPTGTTGSSGETVLSKTKKLVLIVVFVVLVIVVLILLICLIIYASKYSSLKGKQDAADSTTQPQPPSQSPPSQSPPPRKNVRLPDSAVPVHYQLKMIIDPNKEDFSGEEEVRVNVSKATTNIVIHSKKLNITKVEILKDTEDSIEIKRHSYSNMNDFYVIETSDQLKPGTYLLKMSFEGFFRNDLNGLYKGYYRKKDGTIAYFASTFFEPIEARSMFPCFDEPALKATYSMKVVHPKDMMAFSNKEVDTKTDEGSNSVSAFKKTPKMPSYLLTIAVGDFSSSKEVTFKRGVKIRILGQPGRDDQMAFALKMANETLEQLEVAFNLSYPMTQLDLIALPECFIAMGDWGLIHFEEDGLLYKSGFSSEEVQMSLLMRWLPHELVNMWFGNIVTMKWWDDIWLNEAFADYFNYFEASPKSIQSWKRGELFIHTNNGFALELDAFVNSRKVIEMPKVLTSAYIFSEIIYKKGSSVLRMLKHSLQKPNNFITAMQKYLKKHSYKNTDKVDMYNALQEECPESSCINITEFLDPWLTTIGYPVVTVSKNDSKNNTYVLNQDRFVYDKNANIEKNIWRIYFKYKIGHKDDQDVSYMTKWIKDPQVEISWDGDGWLKGNDGQIGFYRVNYDKKTWKSLTEQLAFNHLRLSEADRYGLIDDAFNLARGGLLNITTALNLIGYLRNETDYLPWLGVHKNLGYILSILPVESKTYRQLKRFLAYKSKPIYDKLGTGDTGSYPDKLLRLKVAGFQCDAGLKSCLEYAKDKFTAWKADHMTTSITPALRQLVYYYGVRQGDQKDWEQVLEAVQTTTVPSEIQPFLMGLAGSSKRDVLLNYLIAGQNRSLVKLQYAKYMYDFVANQNPVGNEIALDFVIQRSDLMDHLPVVSKRFSSDYRLKQLKDYINNNLNGVEMSRQLKKVLEVVKLNGAWLKANEKDLANWLEDFAAKNNLASENSLYETRL